MSDSLEVALRTTTLNQPRARLHGLPADEIERLQARLPNLAEVRVEAKLALDLLKQPPPTDVQGMDPTGESLGILHPAIAYHFMLPKLYAFAYFCHEEDVPEDLLLLCLWSLQQKIIAIQEGPDSQLRKIIATPQGKVLPGAKTFMEGQTRSKIVTYLLSPKINRPAEAIPHLEACMKLDEKAKPLPNDVFLRNPTSYVLYGAALARTGTRDAEAKPILERIVKDIDQVKEGAKLIFIEAKLYLARVLRRMGEVEEATKHESYLLNWFKKNPRLIPEVTLRQWFETEDDKDTVFQGLGGMNWLQKRKPTFKTLDRASRGCYNCGVRESPSLKLLRCAKCQYTYYCSRKCQVENHPFHKTGCAERAAELKRAAALKDTAPEDSKCIEDWGRYKNSGFDDVATYHALGLKYDINRGKTHIIIKRMIYIPDGGKDVLDRFRIVEAGVFRISDVVKEIDLLMNYKPGESREVLDELIDEFNHGPGTNGRAFPFFTLFISDDKRIGNYLCIGGVMPKKMRDLKYDPNWRSIMNRKKFTVGPLRLRTGAPDAEHDYTPVSPEKTKANSGSDLEQDTEDKGKNKKEVRDSTMASAPAAALPGLRGMFNKK